MAEPARAPRHPRQDAPDPVRDPARDPVRDPVRARQPAPPRRGGPEWIGDVLGGGSVGEELPPALRRVLESVQEDFRTGRRADPDPPSGEEAPCPDCDGDGAVERENGRWERCPHVEREISARRLARAQTGAGISRRHARCSFANFVPAGPLEFRAQDVVEEYVEEFAARREAGEGLYLFGSTGTGKTHLAYAAVNALIDHPRIQGGVLAVSALDLVHAIKRGFDAPRPRSGEEAPDKPGERLSDAAREAPLLLLDDLGAAKPSSWLFEQMHALADHRYRELLPTLVTSNYAPEDLASRVGSPAASRLLEACPPVEVPGADHRGKRVTQ